jgi:hypothetical protein
MRSIGVPSAARSHICVPICTKKRNDPRLTLAELFAALAVIALATALTATYLLDRVGLGVAPRAGAGLSIVASLAAAVGLGRGIRRDLGGALIFLAVLGAGLGYLFWLAWPPLLPLGSGSDLTHHLVLIDYIEQHGELPHDASAVEYLGEMAHYTPGLHLLAVMTGALARTDGFHALYPVVAVAVALKFAVFCVILLRLLAESPLRLPLSMGGTLVALTVSTYSLGSFAEDSFLAQAAAELFAMAAWWALVWWDAKPGRTPMLLFAVAGVATFLTWPIWVGPPTVALVLLVASKQAPTRAVRGVRALIALLPIAIVVLVHTVGRAGQVAIVGTSGAVVQPSLAVLGWWLPLLSLCGATVAIVQRRHRAAVAFAAAMAMQTAGLWLVAAGRTPYMAIKMIYLAIYPAIAFTISLTDAVWDVFIHRKHRAALRRASLALAWLAVVALGIATRRDVPIRSKVKPVVSNEMFAAGQWARTHVPIGCVDYLVGNEYTAYWLHLAVLGNPRISSRTGDDNTFLTQPSMGRWLVPGPPRYAIANLAILPAEIRGDVNVLQQFGQAAVIERRSSSACP